MGRTVDRAGPFSRGCQGYGPGVSVILPGTRTSRLAYLLISARKEDMQIPREGITSVIILVIIGNAIAAAFWFNPLAYTLYWGKFLGVILSLLGMTLSISLVIWIVSHIIALPIRLLRSH